MAIKLFIVDDHYMVIEGIKSLLSDEESVEWMGHAMNAHSCLAFLQNNLPDVILLDINLPDKSGVDLCREIHQLYPAIKIIGLSTFKQLSFISKMIEHGASGYLLKNATKHEITTALEEVVNGNTYFSNEVNALLEDKKNAIPTVTRREKEVLNLIAEGMTNNEIAEKIFVSVTTVDSHRKNLLMKLDAKNTADLVRLAFKYELIS
ncbi:MAG: response regulator transcription factor [Flavobacteriaceae bacterium]|nr:response regulator transcription factor [Flavobacteriaceae bacterium]